MRPRYTWLSRRGHKVALLAAAIILAVSGGAYIADMAYRPESCSIARTVTEPVTVQSSTFDTLAKARLSFLQSRTTQEEILKFTGLRIGDFDWDAYVKELQGVYQDFFELPYSQDQKTKGDLKMPVQDGGSATSIVQQIHDKLAISLDLSYYGRNISNRASFRPTFPQSIPQIVYTTSRESNEESFPKQFSSWKTLNSEDGWQIKSFNDEDIWQWMTKVFGLEEEIGKVLSGATAVPRVLEIFKQISDGVIRGKDRQFKNEV